MKSSFRFGLFSLALLACNLVAAGPNEVNVLTAWYGQSCGTAHGNVTSHVKASCDGKQSCTYNVNLQVVGDSAPGCRKNFIVLFACSGQTEARLAQLPGEASGSSVAINCMSPVMRQQLPKQAQ
jgi:hypothetical protein